MLFFTSFFNVFKLRKSRYSISLVLESFKAYKHYIERKFKKKTQNLDWYAVYINFSIRIGLKLCSNDFILCEEGHLNNLSLYHICPEINWPNSFYCNKYFCNIT